MRSGLGVRELKYVSNQGWYCSDRDQLGGGSAIAGNDDFALTSLFNGFHEAGQGRFGLEQVDSLHSRSTAFPRSSWPTAIKRSFVDWTAPRSAANMLFSWLYWLTIIITVE